MLKVTRTPPRQTVCLLCGRPAQQSICFGCTVRVQGQAIALKREAERSGADAARV